MLTPVTNTREKLMRAAMEIVARDGFAAATTAAIAAEADVAEGTLYRHFKSKDELLIAAYRGLKSAVFAAAIDGYDEDRPPQARFRHLWRGLFDAYRGDVAAFRFGRRFAESALSKKEGGSAHEAMAGALERLRADALAQGQIKDMPSRLMIGLFYAPVTYLLNLEQSGPAWTEAELDAAARAAWDAWRAAAPD